jgi:hypothetical protein
MQMVTGRSDWGTLPNVPYDNSSGYFYLPLGWDDQVELEIAARESNEATAFRNSEFQVFSDALDSIARVSEPSDEAHHEEGSAQSDSAVDPE